MEFSNGATQAQEVAPYNESDTESEHSAMRRIDQNEHGPSSGGGLYPSAPGVSAAVAPASAAAPQRTFADIVIRRMAHLRGPNIWTYRAVIEAIVDIGELEDYPSNALPGFYERLTAWLPGLIEHRCSVGRRGGFLMRLRDGTWPGHILEHVALELQTQAGMKTGFGKARMTGEHGVYKVVIRTRNEAVGKLAIESARDLVMAAINDRPYDVAATIARLTDLVDRQCLGPSTACIVDAATERGIPHIRLNDGNLVQLGHGAAQRRIWTAETDRTSAIAEGISRDKDLTKQLLAAAGVPVPEGRTVESAEDAWEAAEDIGLPVVVKPSDGNHARGVSLNLKTREEVMHAFAAAEAEGSEVIVESFIPGQEHRLLVVGGKVVAATRGEIIHVSGDGKSTIGQLIDTQVNTDPRRGEEEHLPLVRARGIAGDAALLAAFEALRGEVLSRPRDPAALATDVSAMRRRMRAELDRSEPDRGDVAVFDIKQGEGGLVDLEFLLQALVLREAGTHPGLLGARATPALLAACARSGALDAGTAADLAGAHAALLDAGLRCTLDRRPRRVPVDAAIATARESIGAAVRASGLAFDA